MKTVVNSEEKQRSQIQMTIVEFCTWRSIWSQIFFLVGLKMKLPKIIADVTGNVIPKFLTHVKQSECLIRHEGH